MKPAILILALALLTSEQQRYTSGAEAVRVDVLVTAGGRTVRGLTAADFEVRDNGVLQKIAQVDTERLPLNVIAALDTSGSVAGSKLASLVAATHALVDGLGAVDKVALLTFSGRVQVRVPLTTRHADARSAAEQMTGFGRTTLRDATFAAVSLRDADPARTLLLLFSDGADTASWLTAAQVTEAARRTDVVIYPVGIAQAIETRTLRNPGGGPVRARFRYERQSSPFLDALAEATGGRVMMAGGNADLNATFVKTLAEFRERYVLSYEPDAHAPGWHQLDVRLKRGRGKVTARRGYFSE